MSAFQVTQGHFTKQIKKSQCTKYKNVIIAFLKSVR